jgi:hypothetical protein
MNKEIKTEVDRLKALPQKGHFTCLHHASEMVEESSDLMERVNYILENKPKDEVLVRLKNIHYLSDERYAEYKAIYDPTWKEYEAIRDSSWKAYKAIRDSAGEEYKAIRGPESERYKAIRDSSWKAYKAIRDPAWEEYNKTLKDWLYTWVPFSTWNGKSIFGDE